MTLDDDFAHRELCPDGSCIGVIGPDGRCKVCGTVSPTAVSDPRHVHLTPPPPAALDEVAVDRGDAGDEAFDERELCPDGACVGVLGADRRCKVCRRAADDVPA
jgi:hypothetical protein